jgi:hypothetical protein
LTDQFFLSDNIGLSGFSPSTSKSSRRTSSKQVPSSKNSIASGFSASTEDFQSACEDSEIGDTERYEDANVDIEKESCATGFFGKDILVVSRRQIQIPEESDQDLISVKDSSTMAKKTTQNAVATAVTADSGAAALPEVTKTAPAETNAADIVKESDPHFDVTQHVYSAAKNVWSFGKSIPLGGAILGLYEVAAEKVLDIIVHKDLPGVDSEIQPHLASLDKDVIDPAVLAIIRFFSPAVEKGSEVVSPVVSPIVMTVLKIFPKHIEDEDEKDATAESKEAEREATMPEVSTPVAAQTTVDVN